MLWRVLESMNWSCVRLGFANVDMCLVLRASLRNAVDFMDGVNGLSKHLFCNGFLDVLE